MIVDLVSGDKRGDDNDFRDAMPLNMYAVLRRMFQSEAYMQQEYGLNLLSGTTNLDRVCRGAVYNRRFNTHFVVIGNGFYRVTGDGVMDRLGFVSGTEQVSMPYSFNTQAVISGGNYYLYDSGAGFRRVYDAELGSPIDGIWIANYYVFTDGENIYHTDITNEEEISPFSFATSEYSPDKTIALQKTDDNKLMVIDRESISYFAPSGGAEFAFTYLQSNTLKIGSVSTHAVAEVSGVHYIVGGKKNESISVYAVSLGQYKKVATREIEKILAGFNETDLGDVRLEGRSIEGQDTLIVHLPNRTLAYNLGLPVNVAWYRLGTGRNENYQAINGVFNGDEWVYGNKSDGILASVDTSQCLQYGERAQWEIFTPLIKMPAQSINKLEAETIAGVDDDDTVFVSMGRDGLTYSQEVRMSYGDFGQYDKRFILRRLGYVRNWFTLRLRGYTASKMTFCRLDLT